MGLDVNLYVVTHERSDEEMDRLDQEFKTTNKIWDSWMVGYQRALVFCKRDDEWNLPERIVVQTLSRYYDEHYPRGNWPEIYKAIRALQRLFPGEEVRYGTDSSDWAPEVSEDHLRVNWTRWLEDGGECLCWEAGLNLCWINDPRACPDGSGCEHCPPKHPCSICNPNGLDKCHYHEES